jgi:hypothetical protein
LEYPVEIALWWGKKHKKLAIALTCADWRLHQRKVELTARLARLLGVDGVDLICVPGPDGMLRPERAGEWQAAAAQITRHLRIRGAQTVAMAVLAHHQCLGHPVTDGEHVTDAAATAKALKAATGFSGPVTAAIAIYHSDSHWEIRALGEF